MIAMFVILVASIILVVLGIMIKYDLIIIFGCFGCFGCFGSVIFSIALLMDHFFPSESNNSKIEKFISDNECSLKQVDDESEKRSYLCKDGVIYVFTYKPIKAERE